MAAGADAELPVGPYVQSPDEMLAEPARPAALRAVLFRFLDALLA